MKEPVAFEDAVDLLDTDHKAVKMLFIEYAALCEDGAAAAAKRMLAQTICQALTAHAQLEEEIFYPQVRRAIGDDDLMDDALEEHAQAKEVIARIQAFKPTDPKLDATVKQLGVLIDEHVLEEREQIFLKARLAQLDLRGMALPLQKRRQQLRQKNRELAEKGKVSA